MDPITRLPTTRASTDPDDRDIAEIDAAISMVATGIAARVRLVGLAHPGMAAAVALARTQVAGIRFEIERSPDGIASLTVGPAESEAR